jgi:hypothetical protein
MPPFISTCLIKKVFRKLAVPPAIDAMRELIKISFAPVTRLETPEKIFLKSRAMDTDEPTAAE